jgi:hypothetical protein
LAKFLGQLPDRKPKKPKKQRQYIAGAGPMLIHLLEEAGASGMTVESLFEQIYSKPRGDKGDRKVENLIALARRKGSLIVRTSHPGDRNPRYAIGAARAKTYSEELLEILRASPDGTMSLEAIFQALYGRACRGRRDRNLVMRHVAETKLNHGITISSVTIRDGKKSRTAYVLKGFRSEEPTQADV